MPSASGLEAWGNFYLVTSAAAATLVGLLFVVLTLAADRMPLSETKRIRLYMPPSVFQLALVLVLAAVLTFPTQSRLSATLSCGVIGGTGLIYALLVLRGGVRGHSFRELSDMSKYALLPGAAYITVVIGGT